MDINGILVLAALPGCDDKSDKQVFEATHHGQRHHQIHDSTARLRSMTNEVTWT